LHCLKDRKQNSAVNNEIHSELTIFFFENTVRIKRSVQQLLI